VVETSAFEDGVRLIRAGRSTPEELAEQLLAQLTERELLGLLDGDVSRFQLAKLPKMMAAGPISAGAVSRLGIPGIRFSDGPRGVVVGHSTSFPVTMARAATWDTELEAEVGRAMGVEGRAQGANYSGAVCVNLLRHPAWGRAQECYGEDPVLIGRMGAALTRGLREHVMACVKHFALNSIENARFRIDVTVDEHALHEVYLPHFKRIVEAGVESVMSSYNSINGHWADEHEVLLSDILRDEWGFRGFVTSDWVFGVHDPIVSLAAGMDVEMPLRNLRARALPVALKDGRITRELVLRSGRRILATQIRHAAGRVSDGPPLTALASPEHRALARRAAVRGMVLLKNDPVGDVPLLPLASGSLHRVAIVGHLAAEANLGDRGSSLVRPPTVSTVLDGIREALPGVQVDHATGTDLVAAAEMAADTDAAVVVVGLGADDEGERIMNTDPGALKVLGFPFNSRLVGWLAGKFVTSRMGKGGDRASLSLTSHDELLIAAVAQRNPRTVVVLIGGSAITMERWRGRVPTILLAWYPGMEGGRAIADVLLGHEEPGGRLPLAIPANELDLPFFDSEAKQIIYDAWWGQRKLDRDGAPTAFRFGHGLSYTAFDVTLTEHHLDDDTGTALAHVRNTGERAGATVAQVYAWDADAERAVPQLIGFRRVELDPGATADVVIDLDLGPVRQRDPETRRWSGRPGSWQLAVDQVSPGEPGPGRPL
jgi:beta-glucosidase